MGGVSQFAGSVTSEVPTHDRASHSLRVRLGRSATDLCPKPDGVPVADLSVFSDLILLDHGLCVLSTSRRDGSVAASVVNAGVLQHPVTDVPVVGLVARGLRKLDSLRSDPRATIVARVGWRWAAVEGEAQIIGPDDPHPDVDGERLRLLLREVFVAAGGTHEEWPEYDRVMIEERSAAVLIVPRRTYGNPG